jgi:hypothetical protein
MWVTFEKQDYFNGGKKVLRRYYSWLDETGVAVLLYHTVIRHRFAWTPP